ncbi:MAG: hypothetical protein JEZ00_09665 [Anaerolineaceae bacterium]|nr:hypothetical protein [Anaerolineaceae bacterium]
MKNIIFTFILFSLLLYGCESEKWKEININKTVNDTVSSIWDSNGGIPAALSDWEVFADISDSWFSCDYGYILEYSKMSIDQQNNVWLYGPDHWNSPSGIMAGSLECEENGPKVIVYNSSTGEVEKIELDIVPESHLASASGWTHLENGKILLSSVHLFASLWDEGGVGNEFYDLAFFEDGKFYPISEEVGGYLPVLDYKVYKNLMYTVFYGINLENKIRIFNIETGQLHNSFIPEQCKHPKWIEVNGENIFVICQEENNYKLNIYGNDFVLTHSLQVEDTTEQEFRQVFPLAFDTKGNLWIGYSYIATMKGDQWEIEELYEENDFTYQFIDRTFQRTIIKMMPYKDGMFYNLDGAFYFGNYEEKEWRKIIHNSWALPVEKGKDGKLYVFTGKYILVGEP